MIVYFVIMIVGLIIALYGYMMKYTLRDKFINISKDDELYKEWFLVIDKKMGKSMMVAYDLDGFGKYSDEKMRKFKGAKTTDPKVVSLASEYLNDFLNK